MKTTAIYPGTFDPITHGHVDIIHRGLRLFDNIIVAVSMSAGKSPLFTLEQRIETVEQVFSGSGQITAIPFSGLLVDLMKKREINTILRGIRSGADVDHEFQLASMHQQMKPGIETVFLKADPKFAHISSTIVREIAGMNKEGSLGDLSLFVPQAVMDAFERKNKT